MNRNRIIIGLITIIFLIGLCGCTSQQNNQNSQGSLDQRLFGTWLFTHGVIEQTYTFYSNGTFYFSGIGLGTWSTENGKLYFNYYDVEYTHVSDYVLSNGDIKLSITDSGGTMIYYKQ